MAKKGEKIMIENKKLDEINDAIRGMKFLKESNGRYKLLATTHDDGTITITLNEVVLTKDKEGLVCPLFALKLGDIYAQCAPSSIITRLNEDIDENKELIQEITDYSREMTPTLTLVATGSDNQPNASNNIHE